MDNSEEWSNSNPNHIYRSYSSTAHSAIPNSDITVALHNIENNPAGTGNHGELPFPGYGSYVSREGEVSLIGTLFPTLINADGIYGNDNDCNNGNEDSDSLNYDLEDGEEHMIPTTNESSHNGGHNQAVTFEHEHDDGAEVEVEISDPGTDSEMEMSEYSDSDHELDGSEDDYSFRNPVFDSEYDPENTDVRHRIDRLYGELNRSESLATAAEAKTDGGPLPPTNVRELVNRLIQDHLPQFWNHRAQDPALNRLKNKPVWNSRPHEHAMLISCVECGYKFHKKLLYDSPASLRQADRAEKHRKKVENDGVSERSKPKVRKPIKAMELYERRVTKDNSHFTRADINDVMNNNRRQRTFDGNLDYLGVKEEDHAATPNLEKFKDVEEFWVAQGKHEEPGKREEPVKHEEPGEHEEPGKHEEPRELEEPEDQEEQDDEEEQDEDEHAEQENSNAKKKFSCARNWGAGKKKVSKLHLGWDIVLGHNHTYIPVPPYQPSSAINPARVRPVASHSAYYPARSLMASFTHILPRRVEFHQNQLRKLFTYFIWHRWFDCDMQAITIRKAYKELWPLLLLRDEEPEPDTDDVIQYKQFEKDKDKKRKTRKRKEQARRRNEQTQGRDREQSKHAGSERKRRRGQDNDSDEDDDGGDGPESAADEIERKRLISMEGRFTTCFNKGLMNHNVLVRSYEVTTNEKVRARKQRQRGWVLGAPYLYQDESSDDEGNDEQKKKEKADKKVYRYMAKPPPFKDIFYGLRLLNKKLTNPETPDALPALTSRLKRQVQRAETRRESHRFVVPEYGPCGREQEQKEDNADLRHPRLNRIRTESRPQTRLQTRPQTRSQAQPQTRLQTRPQTQPRTRSQTHGNVNVATVHPSRQTKDDATSRHQKRPRTSSSAPGITNTPVLQHRLQPVAPDTHLAPLNTYGFMSQHSPGAHLAHLNDRGFMPHPSPADIMNNLAPAQNWSAQPGNHSALQQSSSGAFLHQPSSDMFQQQPSSGVFRQQHSYNVFQQQLSSGMFQMSQMGHQAFNTGTSNPGNLFTPPNNSLVEPKANEGLRNSLLSLGQTQDESRNTLHNPSLDPDLRNEFDMFLSINNGEIQPLETMTQPRLRNEEFISSVPQTSGTEYGMHQNGTSSTQGNSADPMLTFVNSFDGSYYFQNDSKTKSPDEDDKW